MNLDLLKRSMEPDLKALTAAMEDNNVSASVQAAHRILDLLDGREIYHDTESCIYRSFSEPFEEALFMQLYHPEMEVKHADPFFAEALFRCGAALFSNGEKDKGAELMKKAHRIEPTNFTIAVTYIETYKMLEKNEEYLKLSLDAFRYAFRPRDIARVYRNIGYYFTERSLYSEAYACYYMSLQYDEDSDKCEMEIDFIRNITKEEFKAPTDEMMDRLKEKYRIPLETNQNIIDIAYAYGKHFYDAGQNVPAKYFLTVAYNLTREAQLQDLIKTL